ncbi:hypothetical protein C1I98_01370 [Spongiactinospora gelatinilytica]|uniref:Carrier domain-containing protein n=1 Tax=Spongiactinospora gelatinilytica TaxID=2666298 RepID=A0A2W2HMQ2_9ACTN|nr:non-ribosomal peptide synthetase [Spongiactinospora gelatinilytica]PZG56419.1 hypothetical protein C1I98_01370 [Spongiactinospora gelatinilytica]
MKRVVQAGPAQERMWLLQEFDPANRSYHESLALDLRGRLDLTALRLALQDVVTRHEALRCGFRRRDDGEVMQVIHPYVPVRPSVVDLTSAPERVAAEIDSAITEPFALAHAPLLRCVVLRLGDDHHVLLFVLHHIICDEGSWVVLLDELFGAYTARLASGEPRLPPVSCQYPDHAEQERRRLRDGEGGASMAYWLRELAGDPPAYPLPYGVPPGGTGPAGEERAELPAPLYERVRALCRDRRMTPFMVLSAAFGYLLHRYGGLEEFVVGTPVTTRLRSGAFRAIGPFVNTCLLRMDLRGGPSVGAYLERCRTTVIGMLGHRDLPFETLASHRRRASGSNDATPFQVMFNVGSGATVPERIEHLSLDLSLLPTHAGHPKFPLSVLVDPADGRPSVVAEYDTTALSSAAVRSLLSHYAAAIEGMLAEPDTPLAAVELLGPDEKAVLEAWGRGPVRPIGSDATLPALLERRAADRPDAPAVRLLDMRLTHGELSRRSNRLARHLRRAGAGPEFLVGVLGARTPQTLVALLGVLKSGAAYLPMDHDHPPERLRDMLRDSGARLVLTGHDADGRHIAYDPALLGAARVLCLDCAAGDIAAQPDGPLEHRPAPDDLAYVIYTSGTTGAPNGVMVEHRALLNHAYAMIDAFGLGADDRVLQFSALGFDVAAEEILPTLLAGGCVEIAPHRVVSVPELTAHLGQAGVTVANLPTGYWAHWAAERRRLGTALPPSPRLVVVGGSPVPAAALRDWQAPGAEHVSVVNAYGVTEATITTTVEHITATPDTSGTGSVTVPIGRPVGGTVVRVLDGLMRPVPVGVAGELWIGGAGVARGYVGRPALTAARFVADPAGPPGARLYRTGDLVRWLPGGRLEFLGRADDQLDIRGHRVEPVEVSAVLAWHPGIAEAAVGLRDGRLVAWIVPAGEASGAPRELRDWLARRLPDHMIPSAWVTVPALPVSAGGKIDHARLPSPRTAPRSARAASGTVERRLTAIWERVLGRSPITPHDDFFALGGDSLSSLGVVAQAREHGLHLSPQDVLSRPTIAELSAVVTVEPPGPPPPEAPPDDSPVPLTPIQHRFFGLDNPAPQHWDQVIVYEVDRRIDIGLLERATIEVIDRHDALRLRFTRRQDGWRQTIGERGETSGPLVLPIDLSEVPPAGRMDVLDAHAARLQAGRSLAGGPLLFLLYGTTPPGQPDLLLLSVHHLAVDGPSTAMLREELFTAYDLRAAGQAMSSPPATVSYATWARWLAEHARDPAVLGDRGFWTAQAAPGGYRPPRDHVLGPADEGSVTVAGFRIDAATTDAFRAAFAGRVHEALLTALALALGEWIGAAGDLVVDLFDHGRRPADPGMDLSRTMGWFSSVFPLRVPIAPAADPARAMWEIGSRWRAVPHAGLSYGLLRHCHPDGPLVPPSPAQVSFNYLGSVEPGPRAVPLRQAPERRMRVRDDRALRPWALSFHAAVAEGRLGVRVVYSRDLHRPETVATLCERYRSAVSALLKAPV